MKKLLLAILVMLLAASCSKPAVNNVSNKLNAGNQAVPSYANWKQYENIKFGYKVKYPDNLSPHDTEQAVNDPKLSAVIFSDWNKPDQERAKNDQVWVYANSRYAPVGIDELKKEEIKNQTVLAGRAADETNVITIAGEQGIQSVYKPATQSTAIPGTDKGPRGYIITFYHKNIRYMITANYNPDMVEGFIKTFEFTK